MCQDLNEKQLRNEELLKNHKSLLYEMIEVGKAVVPLLLCAVVIFAAQFEDTGSCRSVAQ